MTLKDHQVDHLLLLVGGNPLPNYVAGRLLARNARQIKFIHTPQTEDIAKGLAKVLGAPEASLVPLTDEFKPSVIFERIKSIIDSCRDGDVGLHYTGGTKVMAAQARLAARDSARKVKCSYLDARTLNMVMERATESGADGFYFVGDDPEVELKVNSLMELHGIRLKKDSASGAATWHSDMAERERDLAKSILEGEIQAWNQWTAENLRAWDRVKLSYDMKKARDLRLIEMAIPAEGVRAAFMRHGAEGETLEGWAKSAGFKPNSDSITAFAKWLEGGWLEVAMFDLLSHINNSHSVNLSDLGTNYMSVDEANQDLFEFDVAATRGYRLFALSCTTSGDIRLCKGKLFEAYHRARQMGGDEARVALLCAHEKPDDLLRTFRREYLSAEGAVHIFTINQLKRALNDPRSADYVAFTNWLRGQIYDAKESKWTML